MTAKRAAEQQAALDLLCAIHVAALDALQAEETVMAINVRRLANGADLATATSEPDLLMGPGASVEARGWFPVAAVARGKSGGRAAGQAIPTEAETVK